MTTKLFIRCSLVLGLVLAALMVVTLTQGPRLRLANVDTRAVVLERSQRLILQANQPVAKVTADDVRIDPAVPFTVTSSANSISLTFRERLRYGTGYTVVIKGVTSAFGQGAATTFSHSFTTYNPSVYSLQRAGDFDRSGDSRDAIVRRSLGGGQAATVFTAKRIQEFTILGDRLLVVTVGADGTNQLKAVSATSGLVGDMPLPAKGYVDQLQASGDGTTYGFRFSDNRTGPQNQFQNQLFIHNTSPGRTMIPLDGLGGKPLQVTTWQFAPDGAALIARQYDGSLTLVDTEFGHLPAVLGVYDSMGTFDVSGQKLVVRRGPEFTLLDVPARKLATLDMTASRSKLTVLDILASPNRDRTYVHAQFDAQAAGGTGLAGSLYLATNQGNREIYAYDAAAETIRGIQLTPNDQFAIIESASQGVEFDGYPVAPRPKQTKILIQPTNGDAKPVTISGNDPYIQ